LWELLVGERPFQDGALLSFSPPTLAAMVARRREPVDPAALIREAPGCPAGLIEVLQTCLAPEPAGRYVSAAEAARQLDLCLDPQVDRLLRPQPRGWVSVLRRHPTTALVLAGVVP